MAVAAVSCADCGRTVDPARADVTADGPVCNPCSLRRGAESAAYAVAARNVAALETSLDARAGVLAKVHAIVLGGTVVGFAAWTDEPYRWAFVPVVIAVLTIAVGLGRRARWAYLGALALDAVLAGAVVVAGIVKLPANELWVPALVAAIPAILILLLRGLRTGFLPAASHEQD